MTIAISCSWCGALNRQGEPTCGTCGHPADRPRLACDCPTCRRALPVNLQRWAADWRDGWRIGGGARPFN